MRVLIACEFSGVVRRAFAARGHDAKEIAGFPGYIVTSDGHVFSNRTARGHRHYYSKMAGRVDAKGYLGVVLCARDARRSARIHRLVAEAFIENPRSLPVVRHMDGNPAHNACVNLEWGTYADNEADKIAHGTYDLRRTGKLSAAQRELAVALVAGGASQKDVASQLSVSRSTITRLINGSTWGGMKCAQ